MSFLLKFLIDPLTGEISAYRIYRSAIPCQALLPGATAAAASRASAASAAGTKAANAATEGRLGMGFF